jgi:hypothetical protein
MASACYVYAILARETPLPAGLRGIDGAAVALVPYRALAAATSPLEHGPPRPTPQNVWRHEAVVEALLAQGSALPVRFGTVLAEAAAVARALAARYDVLAADLARLGDKVEFSLSVLWDPPRSQEQEPAPRRAAPGPGARYLHARLAASRREAAAREQAQALAHEMDRELSVHTLERRCTLLPTPRLAVRAAYLLEPGRVPAFQDAFAQLRRAHPALRLLLSGPWPPYSFVTPPQGDEQAAERPPVGTRSTSDPGVQKREPVS